MSAILAIKLVTMGIAAVLNFLGGWHWLFCRRFIMPFICAVVASISTECWWLGITMLVAMAPLTIGYGEHSILEHIFNDAWARFVWMVLVAFGFSAGPCWAGYLSPWMCILYVVANATVAMTCRNINVRVSDPLFGLGLSSILLLLHPH